jgi:uncharacterized glyoxalase superfamily protein PhnB
MIWMRYIARSPNGSVRVDEPPQETPWGTREMCVIDPDGNRLRFGDAKSTQQHAADSASRRR